MVPEQEKTGFIRFPNKYIRNNIKEKYNLKKIFYTVYILINRYRTPENYSWITIEDIYTAGGYSHSNRKTSIYKDIVSVLKYMESQQMINLAEDIGNYHFKDGIKLKINPRKFDSRYWTAISREEVDIILSSESPIDKNHLLETYLYILSYIKGDGDNAFYQSIQNMSAETIIYTNLAYKCVNELVRLGLLKKYRSNQKVINKNGLYLPNIYVNNNLRSFANITQAINKIEERSTACQNTD